MNAVRVEPRLLGQFPEDQKGAGTGQRAASGVQKELGAMAGVEVGPTACEIAQERLCSVPADGDDALLAALSDHSNEAVVGRPGASYFAFYDLASFQRSLGMFMMTSAVQHFANIGYHAIHLGTCYSEKALYKTQFAGVQFCNGAGWSANLDELKFLIRRERAPVEKHLFDTPEYLEQFCGGSVAGLEKTASFNLGKPSTLRHKASDRGQRFIQRCFIG